MRNIRGFTLIELLVSISIIGVLVTVSIFGLRGSRESARDAKRRADLETIKGVLALYYADCREFPAPGSFWTGSLNGDGNPASCDTNNIYISEMPEDPQEPARSYYYNYPYPAGSQGYILCAALEDDPMVDTAGCPANCGSTACNYRTTGS